MTTFLEQKLSFTFGPAWTARKWDDEDAYRQGIARLHGLDCSCGKTTGGSKATDFVALRSEHLLYLEVKDFRGHRIENKPRLKDGELAKEVALKVRDTIAGIVGARRTRGDGDGWATFAEAAAKAKHPVHVVLWLEQDVPPQSPRGALDRARNSLEQELKKQLRWLTTHVFVASLERAQRLADIAVTGG